MQQLAFRIDISRCGATLLVTLGNLDPNNTRIVGFPGSGEEFK
jgi:hypothetical protein